MVYWWLDGWQHNKTVSAPGPGWLCFVWIGLDWTDGMGIVMSIGPEDDLDLKKQPTKTNIKIKDVAILPLSKTVETFFIYLIPWSQ